MKSGARGIAAGRNIFLAADPVAKAREVRKVLDANFVGALGVRPIELARIAPDGARIAADGGTPGLELRS
jgi:hypothetical protein